MHVFTRVCSAAIGIARGPPAPRQRGKSHACSDEGGPSKATGLHIQLGKPARKEIGHVRPGVLNEGTQR